MACGAAGPKGAWARRGLSWPGPLDRTTQAMLLRQLYLSHFDRCQFDQAYEIASQALGLGVLADVVHQDCARAKQAAGELDLAVGHLRLAARLGPPSRRAFHWWTMGAVLLLAGRAQEAIAALSRAARWGAADKPLYQGHLALARIAAGQRVRNAAKLIDRLAKCPAGQGYGRFVLGQLAFHNERWEEARAYLESFVRRTAQGRRVTGIALAGEVEMAKHTLCAITGR